MINQEIADIFDKMASYIDLMGGKNAFFKSRAFRKASEVVASLPIDLDNEKFVKHPQMLVAIEGIGNSIANHIVEYIQYRKIEDYERFKEECPVDLEGLSQVQGLGPKKILKLYKMLGIKNIDELKEAAESDKISQLDGFGEKSQQNILESISFAITNKDRKPYFLVEPIVKEYIDYMKSDPNLKKIDVLGSFRRRKDMIGDIDFLVISDNPSKTMEHFRNFKNIEKILGSGDTKSSVWLSSKIQADIRVVPEDSWGAASQYFTGNKDHNVKLRNIAISKGFKLSEYSLSNRKTNEVIESKSEEQIYEKIGLQYVIPELRENNGEVELAIKNNLPQVVENSDITGDLHTHTTYSDGTSSIIDMVNAAKSKGYEYIGISDHLGLTIAGGIPKDQFKTYLSALRNADSDIDGIKIYAGAECEVNKEGEYVYPEELLAELDYVIAGVHLATKMDPDAMTKRLEKIIKNPLTKIIAHPTGRILGQRPSYEYDYEYIFELCAKQNVILEINSDPHRLDLNDSLVRTALKFNCKIAINTDAHSIEALDNIRYGVNIARRGWLTPRNLFKPSF